MSTIELKRKNIIREIETVEDEWVLKAVERLLNIDDDTDIPDWHKKVLDERLTDSENENELLSAAEVKAKLSR